MDFLAPMTNRVSVQISREPSMNHDVCRSLPGGCDFSTHQGGYGAIQDSLPLYRLS